VEEKEYYCIHLTGLVQGVGMRYYVNKIAKIIGLRGYVKNLSDGRVECIIHAAPQKLEQLIQYLNQSPRGKIEEIAVKDCLEAEEFEDFTIRY